jgi:hypothetical protein
MTAGYPAHILSVTVALDIQACPVLFLPLIFVEPVHSLDIEPVSLLEKIQPDTEYYTSGVH